MLRRIPRDESSKELMPSATHGVFATRSPRSESSSQMSMIGSATVERSASDGPSSHGMSWEIRAAAVSSGVGVGVGGTGIGIAVGVEDGVGVGVGIGGTGVGIAVGVGDGVGLGDGVGPGSSETTARRGGSIGAA